MKKRKNEVRLLNELQRQKDKLSRANAIDLPHMSTQPQVIDIPSPPEDMWSPCASSRGVKMFIATICSAHRQIKSADFIGAYLQAKVVGRHFVKLPIEYAYHFPNMPNTLELHYYYTKVFMVYHSVANIGTQNFLNGYTPLVFINPLQIPLTLFVMTNMDNGSDSSFMLMTCFMQEVMTNLKKILNKMLPKDFT